MRSSLKIFLAGVCMLAGMGTARAGFIGFTIGVETQFPTLGTVCCGSGSAVVGSGIEFPTGSFPNYNSNAFIDVGDLQIDYGQTAATTYTSGAFNGFRFFDTLGTIAPITGVSINGATNLAGFNSSRLSFDADNIFINLQGLSAGGAHLVRLDVQFGSTAVPEPSAILFLGSGLTGIAILARRRRQRWSA
jgi:hypothetical protein